MNTKKQLNLFIRWLIFSVCILFEFCFLSCEIGLGAAVDTEAPTISISSPDQSSIIREGFKISGVCKDDARVEYISVVITNTDNGTEYKPENIIPEEAAGKKKEQAWEFLANYKKEDGTWFLPDGNYTFSFTAWDASSRKSGEMIRSIVIDNTAPLLVLTRPSASDTYGQKFDITGQVADDNNIDLLLIDVYAYNPATGERGEKLTVKPIELKNVPPTIDLTAAVYGDENYKAIYGDDKNAGNLNFCCDLVIYDAARKFPPEEGDKGNSSNFYYMYNDIYTDLLSKYKMTQLYHMQSGALSYEEISKAEQDKAVLILSKEIGDEGSIRTNSSAFTLNPLNNPTYEVIGYKVVSSFTSLKKGNEYKISNGSQVTVKISSGLDRTPIINDTIGIKAFKVQQKGEDGWEPAEFDESGKPKTYTIFPAYKDKDGNILLTDEEKISERAAAIKEIGSYDRTITINIGSDDSELKIGETYLFDVTAYDQNKNDIYNVDGNYGFFLASSGVAATLSVDQPSKNTLYINNDEGTKITFEGSTFHEEGMPLIRITVKHSEKEYTKDFIVPEENLKLAEDGRSYDFSYEMKPADFIPELSLSESAQYDFSIFAVYSGIDSSPVNKTVMYDIGKPEINITSLSPIADSTVADSVNGKEYNVNGTITIRGSFNDEDTAIDSESMKYKYKKADGTWSEEKDVTKQQNFTVKIDTKELKDKADLDVIFLVKDKAGNITEEAIYYEGTTKYFVDQDTDYPIVAVHDFKEKDENGNTEPRRGFNTTTQSSKITGQIIDDDGIRKISIQCLTKDSNGNYTVNFDDGNTIHYPVTPINITNEAEEKNAKCQYNLSQDLPSMRGNYKLIIEVEDINKVVTKWECYIRVSGNAPELSDITKDRTHLAVSANGKKEIVISGNITGEHSASSPLSIYAAKTIDEETGIPLNKVKVWDVTEWENAEGKTYSSGDTISWSHTFTMNDEKFPLNKKADGSIVQEGMVKIYLQAEDEAGFTSTVKTFEFIADDTVPVVSTLTTAKNSAGYITAASSPFGTTFRDISGVTEYYWQISSSVPAVVSSYADLTTENGWTMATAGLINSFYGNFKEKGSAIGVDSLEEGAYSVYVIAVDKAENVSAPKSETFKVDLKAPVITIDNTAVEERTKFKLSGKISDSIGLGSVSKVSIRESGSADLIEIPVSAEDGTWASEDSAFPTSGKDGIYTYTVNATDEAGNPAAPVSYSVNFDGTAPNVSIAKPTDGEWLTGDGTSAVLVKGTAMDGSGVGVAKVYYGLTPTGPWTQADGTNDNWEVSIIPGGEGLAKKTVWIYAEDKLGNSSVPVSRALNIDNTIPTISNPKVYSVDANGQTEVLPKNGLYFVGGNFKITVKASDTNALAANNPVSCNGGVVEQEAGLFSYSGTESAIYEFKATDIAGKESSVLKVNVTVDNENPTSELSVTTLIEDYEGHINENVVNRDVKIKGTSTDNDKVDSISVKIFQGTDVSESGIVICEVTSENISSSINKNGTSVKLLEPVDGNINESFTFNMDSTKLETGKYTIVFSVKDRTGNVATVKSQEIYVDQASDVPKLIFEDETDPAIQTITQVNANGNGKNLLGTSDDNRKITFSASDDDGSPTVKVWCRKWDTSKTEAQQTAWTTEPQQVFVSKSFSYVIPRNSSNEVEEGFYQIKVEIADKYGLSGTGYTFITGVSSGAPVVNIKKNELTFVRNSQPVNISVQYKGGNSLTRTVVKASESEEDIVDESETFLYDTPTNVYKTKDDTVKAKVNAAGKSARVTVTYTATNMFNETDSASYTYLIDNVAPVSYKYGENPADENKPVYVYVNGNMYDSKGWNKKADYSFTTGWTDSGYTDIPDDSGYTLSSEVNSVKYWITSTDTEPVGDERGSFNPALKTVNGNKVFTIENRKIIGCEEGESYVWFKAIDAAGNESGFTKVCVRTDSTPPVLTLNQKETVYVPSTENFKVTGTLVDAFAGTNKSSGLNKVTPVRVLLGETELGKVNGALGNDGSFEVALSGFEGTAPYSITVVGLDAEENETKATFTLDLDIEKPTVVVKGPVGRTVNQSLGSTENPVTIFGTASDNKSQVKAVYYQILDASAAKPAYNAGTWTKIDTTGAWSETLASVQSKGKYKLYVYAEDNAGNKSDVSEGVEYHIDYAAPTVTLNGVSYTENTVIPESVVTNTEEFTFVYSVADVDGSGEADSGIATTTFKVLKDGTDITSTFDKDSAEDGSYDFTVRAVDNVGKVTEVKKTIRLDTKGPVISFVSPAFDESSMSAWQKTQRVKLSGSANDNSGIDKVYYKFDSAGTMSKPESWDGWAEAIGTTSWSFEKADYAQGESKVWICASDIYGNVSDPVMGIIRVDTETPEIGETLFQENPLLPNGKIYVRRNDDPSDDATETATLSGIVTDSYKLKRVHLWAVNSSKTIEHGIYLTEEGERLGTYLDGTKSPLYNKLIKKEGNENKEWEWTIDLPFTQFEGDTWTFYYQVEDESGQIAEQKTDLVIDTVAPSLTLAYVTTETKDSNEKTLFPTDWTKNTRMTLIPSDITEEGSGIATAEYFVSETVYSLPDDSANSLWSPVSVKNNTVGKQDIVLSTNSSKDTYQYVYFRVTDYAGNTKYISSTGYRIDTEIPSGAELESVDGKDPTIRKLANGDYDVKFVATPSDAKSGVKSVQVLYDGSIKGSVITDNTDGKFELTVAKEDIATSGEAKKTSAQIGIRITDNAGNYSDINLFSINIDSIAPDKLEIKSIPDASVEEGYQVNKEIEISGTANDDQILESVTLQYKTTGDWIDAETSGTYNWSAKINTSDSAFTDKGKFQVRLVAKDSAGNTSESDVVEITVDQATDIPVITVDGMKADGTGFIAQRKITGSVEDDDGNIDFNDFKVSTDDGENWNDVQVLGTSRWSYTLDGDGEYSIKFKMKDAAGSDFSDEIIINGDEDTQSTDGTLSFHVDILDPVVSAELYKGTEKLETQAARKYSALVDINAVVKITASDANGLAEVGAYFGAREDGDSNVIKQESPANDAEVTLTVPVPSDANIQETKILTYYAKDNSGRESSHTYTVIIDNAAPEITVTNPSSTYTIAGETTVSGTTSDGTGGTGIADVRWFIPSNQQIENWEKTGDDAMSDSEKDALFINTINGTLTWAIEFKADSPAGKLQKYFSSEESNNSVIWNNWPEDGSDAETFGVKVDGTSAIYDLPIYFRIEDNVGNVTYYTGYSVRVNPDGDRPTAEILYPTLKDDGSPDTLSGSIRVNGEANDEVNAVKEVHIEIQKSANNENNEETVWNDVAGYTDKIVTGTYKWNYTFDSSLDVFAPVVIEGEEAKTTTYLRFRVWAVDENDLVGDKSEWTIVQTDKNSPLIGKTNKLKLVKYKNDTAGNDILSSVEYEEGMYVSGTVFLEFSVEDEQGLKSVSVGTSEMIKAVTYADTQSEVSTGYEGYDKVSVKLVTSGSGSLEFTIKAVENTDNELTSTRGIKLRYDNTAPVLEALMHGGEEVGIGAGKVTVKQSNNTYALKSEIDENDSGLAQLFMFWTRTKSGTTDDKRVYDPRKSENNVFYSKGDSATIKFNDDGLPYHRYENLEISARNKFTLNSADPFLTKGNYVYVDGTYRKITDVDDKTYTFTPATDSTSANVDAIYAVAVDNERTEAQDLSSGDDGDGIWESLVDAGATYNWEMNFDSLNIPDGPITITCLAIDSAGNKSSLQNTVTKIENHAPRIAKVRLGTDLNKDTKISKAELTVYDRYKEENNLDDVADLSSEISLDTEGFTVKSGFVIIPEFVGGNISDDESMMMVLKRGVTGVSADNKQTFTTYLDPASESDSGEKGDLKVNEFVSVENEMTEIYDPITDGDNDERSKLSSKENGIRKRVDSIFRKFYLSNSQLYGEGDIENTPSGNSENICLTFWDATEETVQGTDSQTAVLYLKGMKYEMVDKVSPVAEIKEFKWENKDDNSLYENNIENGHIELKSDLKGDWEGYTSEAPKVSGKITFRGTAYDNVGLSKIKFVFGNSSNASAWIGDDVITATYNSGSWNLSSNGGDMNTNHWSLRVFDQIDPVSTDDEEVIKRKNFKSTDAFFGQEGHKVAWELDLDTEYWTGRVVTEDAEGNSIITVNPVEIGAAFTVIATDNSTDTEGGNTSDSSYTVDVVPYITNVETGLSNVKEDYDASIYNRTAKGHYPVNWESGKDSIVITGFNLGADSITVNPHDLSSSGAYEVEVGPEGSKVKSINNMNNNDAKGSYKGSDKDNWYNRYQNKANNNELNDDVYFDVWEFNDSAAQTNDGVGLLREPIMKLNPVNGKVGFAFGDGPSKFSMPQNNSYKMTQWNYATYINISLAYDELGQSYSTATGLDTYQTQDKGGKFSYFTDLWGTSLDKADDSNFTGEHTNRFEAIGLPGGTTIHGKTLDSLLLLENRFYSPSIAVTTKNGANTYTGNSRVYMAYFDDIYNQIRFRYGEMPKVEKLSTYNRVNIVEQETKLYSTLDNFNLVAENDGNTVVFTTPRNRYWDQAQYNIPFISGRYVRIGDKYIKILNNDPGNDIVEGDYHWRVITITLEEEVKKNNSGYSTWVYELTEQGTGVGKETFGQIVNGNNANEVFVEDHCSIIAGQTGADSYIKMDETSGDSASGANVYAGNYVSIDVIPGTTASEDVVVATWFDSKNNQWMYSYNENPDENADTDHVWTDFLGENYKWATPKVLRKNAGEYCKIVVAPDNSIHIASKSQSNEILYTYIPTYNGTPQTVKVETYEAFVQEVGIDVGTVGGKTVPYISYWANSRPKLAFPVTGFETTSTIPSGVTGTSYNGNWEVSYVPTSSSLIQDHINVSDVNATIAALDDSTTENFHLEGDKGSGEVYSNGTTNPLLGYGIRKGTSGYIEIAQKK